jgi:dihydrofolate synthase/folylpolyglutamate synthase
MNYPDSVRFLYSLGNEVKTAKLGLERIGNVLEALGNPHRLHRIVHVAGTNGKGSTCAMIASGLTAAGLRTGLFTSPHLVAPTERIQVDGRAVTADQFAAAFNKLHAVAEHLLDRGAIDLHPTYFESVTAMAFLVFRDLRVDAAVIEVGLGGRLDASNVVTPELSVITPIDFDHEALLGKSLQAIAREKAGILKPGVPAIFSRQRPEAQAELDRRAAELQIEVINAEQHWRMDDLVCHARGSSFTLHNGRVFRIECPLAGAHQVENAVTAVAALDRLGIPARDIEQGVAHARWPGRLQHISESPEIILDGAHNPAGARALAGYLAQFHADRHIVMIYGAMRDKAVEEMTGILFPHVDEVIATAPNQLRSVDPETIRELAAHPCVRLAPRLAEALEMAREAPSDSLILITGSLFLVGEALELLNG